MLTAAWGTVPEWIGGLGTAGALIVAVIVFQRGVLDRRDESLARQARGLDVWVHYAEMMEDPAPHLNAIVYVANAGTEAIRRLDVELAIRGRHLILCSWGTLAPSMREHPHQMNIEVGSPACEPVPRDLRPGLLVKELEVVSYFQDDAGNRWRRNNFGGLSIYQGPALSERSRWVSTDAREAQRRRTSRMVRWGLLPHKW